MIGAWVDVVSARAREEMGWEELAGLARDLAEAATRVELGDEEIPWGRYLLHADPAGRFTIQLDAFSAPYRGEIHSHGTWGAFAVLRGRLHVEDHRAGDFACVRASTLAPGGAMAFLPPEDWHRVSTLAGPQVLSVHCYGPGLDLEWGTSLGEDGRLRRYRRSPWQERRVWA